MHASTARMELFVAALCYYVKTNTEQSYTQGRYLKNSGLFYCPQP